MYDACAGKEQELVVDKIKSNLKGRLLERDGSGGQTARCDVERGLPPVIDVGMQFKLDLAYDLRPHMDGAIGILPLLQRQRGPDVLAFGPAERWKGCFSHVYLL